MGDAGAIRSLADHLAQLERRHGAQLLAWHAGAAGCGTGEGLARLRLLRAEILRTRAAIAAMAGSRRQAMTVGIPPRKVRRR